MKVINKVFFFIVLVLVLVCVVFLIFLNTGNDADKKAMIYGVKQINSATDIFSLLTSWKNISTKALLTFVSNQFTL